MKVVSAVSSDKEVWHKYNKHISHFLEQYDNNFLTRLPQKNMFTHSNPSLRGGVDMCFVCKYLQYSWVNEYFSCTTNMSLVQIEETHHPAWFVLLLSVVLFFRV